MGQKALEQEMEVVKYGINCEGDEYACVLNGYAI